MPQVFEVTLLGTRNREPQECSRNRMRKVCMFLTYSYHILGDPIAGSQSMAFSRLFLARPIVGGELTCEEAQTELGFGQTAL